MKWNSPAPPKRKAFTFCLLLFSMASIFILSGCHCDKKVAVIKPWVDIRVQFKPGTTSETEDSVIGLLEKMLKDTINIMRQEKYPDFSPAFVVQKFPYMKHSGEVVELLAIQKGIFASSDTSVNNPPICLCKTKCQVCLNAQSYVTPNGPVQSILIIDDSKEPPLETNQFIKENN